MRKGVVWLIEGVVLTALAKICEQLFSLQIAIDTFIVGAILLIVLQSPISTKLRVTSDRILKIGAQRPMLSFITVAGIGGLLGFTLFAAGWLYSVYRFSHQASLPLAPIGPTPTPAINANQPGAGTSKAKADGLTKQPSREELPSPSVRPETQPKEQQTPQKPRRAGEAETNTSLLRRQNVLRGLVHEYLLSHDGLTAAELAGTEITQREADWINGRLQEKGERWNVSPTTKQPPSVQQPPVIIQTAPTFGNLKQRTVSLSEEMMEDLYIHGWPGYGGQKFPPGYVIRQMPTKEPENSQWLLGRTRVFRFRFLQKVLDIRNEFAQLHIRDNDLDNLLCLSDLAESASGELKMGRRPENELMLPQDIEFVAERLKVLADQVK